MSNLDTIVIKSLNRIPSHHSMSTVYEYTCFDQSMLNAIGTQCKGDPIQSLGAFGAQANSGLAFLSRHLKDAAALAKT